MNKLRFSAEDIQFITLFESKTKAKVKDFLRYDNAVFFLVEEGDMGLAIGKRGVKVEKLRKAIDKQVIVFEYNPDSERFLKNMFYPIEVHGLEVVRTSSEKTAVVQVSIEDKKRAVGSKGVKIKAIREFAQRHFDIESINLRAV